MQPTRQSGSSPQQPQAQTPSSSRAADLFPLPDWLRHHALRSWPVVLFLLLICVPSVAIVVLGQNPTAGDFDVAAWIFAAYFALAWLLLLGLIVRPHHVTRQMLLVEIAVALLTEVPLALALETALNSSNASLGASIFTIGLPEELAKAVPIAFIALVYRNRKDIAPRDYLFIGAVSGLVFGASEVVRYFTVNGIEAFYLTVKAAVPDIEQLMRSGHSAPDSVFAVLIGPVLFFIIEFVWRFLTDPITHACWSGLTGYFIGLSLTSRYSVLQVGWIGLAAASILHGLNDWGRINDHPVWILVVAVSGILFLCYARVGARQDLQYTPPIGRSGSSWELGTGAADDGDGSAQAPVVGAGAGARGSGGSGDGASAGGGAAGGRSRDGSARPWWEH
jgi:RsiW-degrading membrane proteinase PrsW (M82 family)